MHDLDPVLLQTFMMLFLYSSAAPVQAAPHSRTFASEAETVSHTLCK